MNDRVETITLTPPKAAPAHRTGDYLKGHAWRLGARLLPPLIFLAGTLLLWEALVHLLNIAPYVLPAPSEAFRILGLRFEPIFAMAMITLRTTLIGFFCGVSLGLTLGILIGSSRNLYSMVYPALIGFNAIPAIALIPVFIIWFGVGPHISVMTAVVVCFFPVTVVVATAVAASSPELSDVLRSLGASRTDIMLKVALPRAMPQFFSSIKLAITGAFIGTIVAETVASNTGIGYLMIVASNNMDVPLAFAGLFVLAAMGVALYTTSLFLEKRLTGWAYRKAD
jgi:NitT/TauT family transport system permease protein